MGQPPRSAVSRGGDIFIPAGEELKMKHRFEDEEL
jgi:hypothetical protein